MCKLVRTNPAYEGILTDYRSLKTQGWVVGSCSFNMLANLALGVCELAIGILFFKGDLTSERFLDYAGIATITHIIIAGMGTLGSLFCCPGAALDCSYSIDYKQRWFSAGMAAVIGIILIYCIGLCINSQSFLVGDLLEQQARALTALGGVSVFLTLGFSKYACHNNCLSHSNI